MITIEEFRIGNYLLVDEVPRKVCCLKDDNGGTQGRLIGFENNSDCEYENVDSERLGHVRITDQLLMELGFTFHDHFKLWQHTRPDKSYSIELNNDYFPLDFAHRPIVRNMLYLHQLQNLFYIIQGEELRFGSDGL